MRIKGRFFAQRLVRGLAAWMLLAGILGLATPRQAAAQSNAIGINISSVSGYDTDRLFADAMKHARPFAPAGNPGGAPLTAPNIDANGWPNGDASVLIWEGVGQMNGTYHLTYNGAGSFSLGGIAYSVANQSYNSGTNATSADIIISDAASSNVWLNFTGVSGGAKNIKLMRPTSPGASASYAATTTFTDQMKNLIGKFSAIRFMDFTATNWNEISQWGQRPLPTYATQQPPANGYNTGWQGRGAAWEYAIQLCNETNKDAWICVPVNADANYVTQLATLWKNNLNSNLKIYVEYSNEVWNYSFSQWTLNHNAAVAEVNAGGSPINFDGETNDGYWAWRRVGKRCFEISNQFRTVFGDAAMGTRIRPALQWQQGYAETGRQSLLMAEYLARQNNRSVNYYIYGGGGSAYYNPQNDSDSLDINNIWTSDTFNTANWASPQRSDADWSAAYGIARLAYEGGPSMDNIGHSEAVKRQAWGDTRMRGIVKGHQDFWSSYNGALLMYFNSTGGGDYQWAFTDFPWNLNSQKLLAINDINGSSPAALVVGSAIPANVPGGAYAVASRGWGYPGSGSGSINVQANNWFGWSVRNASAGSYNVVVNFSSNGTGTLRFWSDGAIIGTYNFPNTGGAAQDSSAFAVSLSAGLHGLRVESMTGSFDVQQLKITSGGSGGGTGTGLRGTYFNNKTLTVPSALVRTDSTVNFDWGNGSYASGQPTDNFSARWDGQVEAPVSGSYTFTTNSDDGVRLWVNGVQIINNWTDHAPTDNSGTITLTAGTKYNIVMEFYENGGGAVAKLDWAYPGQARQNVPQSRLYPATGGGSTTVTLNPTDDTDTQSDVAAGTNAEINASQWNTIFARFDFTSVTGTVSNAKFRIYKPYATSSLSAILEQTTTDSWTQSNRGALPGVGATIQTIAAADAAGYIEFDVTALVQARMSGSKIVSFALNTPIGTWTSFQSKEGANKPQLVITKN